MKAHVIGVPKPFKCECGEQFVLATWKKDKFSRHYDIDFVSFPGEMPYCPFCGGRGGIKVEEFA